MKTSKSVVCKCERCNKPFKAYVKEAEMLCRACKAIINEEKLESMTGEKITKSMTRTAHDAVMNSCRSTDVNMKLMFAEMDARDAEKKRKNEAAMTLKCKDCGEKFTITVGEKEFYESKGLFLPVRCSSCRKNRKANGVEKCVNILHNAPTVDAVEVVHAEWLDVVFDPMWRLMSATCSHCMVRGEVRVKRNECGFAVPDSDYCPNCGAIMDGGINNGTLDR